MLAFARLGEHGELSVGVTRGRVGELQVLHESVPLLAIKRLSIWRCV
jgi:hypothetical protein